jgi:hypothetical protein
VRPQSICPFRGGTNRPWSDSRRGERAGAGVFSDLVVAALGFLPRNAPHRTAEERQALKRLVEAAALAGANDWPGEALALFQQLSGISMGVQPHLPVGAIGAALDDFWKAGRPAAWQLRADIGGDDYRGETA